MTLANRKYKRIRELAALIIARSYEGSDAAIASLARQIVERTEPTDSENLSADQERIEKAFEVIAKYGNTDGEWHKQWIIDQVLRALCTDDEYDDFVSQGRWDTGIAP